MDSDRLSRLDLKTPCYLIDRGRIEENCRLLARVRERTGCRVLLALKAFAAFSLFPLIRKHLDGVCASGLYEARLGREEFGAEVHTHAPAFVPEQFGEIARLSDFVVFNSVSQLERFRADAERENCVLGLRVNPGYSEVETALYNPCAPGSRLGVRAAALAGADLPGVSGLHFHALCEQGADVLERVLARVEARFGHLLERMEWLNLGGGHHVTRPGYDVDLLCRLIDRVRERYRLQVYIEPGEAVALNAGWLAATVLDTVDAGGMAIAILDTSAETHMPDVLAMPYRPQVLGAGGPGELPHTFRLAGNTCLAGDVIGDYSFPRPLEPGDRLFFTDMAHYTMVKNTTFNGAPLPSIAVLHPGGRVEVVRRFSYEDFRNRLS